MATVTFSNPPYNCTIRANIYPERRQEPPRQKVGMSEGGAIKVALLGDPDDIQPLSFARLSVAHYTALRTFIQDGVNYSEEPFTFTDAHSVDHTNMRYISGLETFEKRRPGVYYGTLIIRKDLSL